MEIYLSFCRVSLYYYCLSYARDKLYGLGRVFGLVRVAEKGFVINVANVQADQCNKISFSVRNIITHTTHLLP